MNISPRLWASSSTAALSTAWRRPPAYAASHARRRLRLSTTALSDPYKVLGVPPTASEAEIKRAHRRAVLEHHPDRQGGCELAQRRFMAVQEAYEIIVGKRSGKEVSNQAPGNQDSWEFHDWWVVWRAGCDSCSWSLSQSCLADLQSCTPSSDRYWKFSMSRRQRRAAAGRRGAAAADPPPPGAWKQQLAGLRQKAAAKRAMQQQAAGSGRGEASGQHEQNEKQDKAAMAAAHAAKVRSDAWRSTTRNARRPSEQPAAAMPSTLHAQAHSPASPLPSAETAAVQLSAGHHHQQGPSGVGVHSSAIPAGSRHARQQQQQQQQGDALAVDHNNVFHASDQQLAAELEEATRRFMQQHVLDGGEDPGDEECHHHCEQRHQKQQHEAQTGPQAPRPRFANRSEQRERVSCQLAGLRRRAALREDLL